MIEKIRDLKYKKENLISQLKKNQIYLDEKEDEFKKCLEAIEYHKIAYQSLESIICESNEMFIKKIESLLNKGIKNIFTDESYELKLLSENKKLIFILIDNNNKNSKGECLEIDIEDACGGGIMTVIGFILQLFMISLLGLSKTLFIDEGFMSLSSDYRPRFYEFLREFCIESDMKIMLISHDEIVKEYAENIIEISHGKVI